MAAEERLKVTVEPGAPVPELRGKETCCPLARVVMRLAKMTQATTRSQSLNHEVRSVLEKICSKLTRTLLGRTSRIRYQSSALEAGVFSLQMLHVSHWDEHAPTRLQWVHTTPYKLGHRDLRKMDGWLTGSFRGAADSSATPTVSDETNRSQYRKGIVAAP